MGFRGSLELVTNVSSGAGGGCLRPLYPCVLRSLFTSPGALEWVRGNGHRGLVFVAAYRPHCQGGMHSQAGLWAKEAALVSYGRQCLIRLRRGLLSYSS